MEASCRLLIMRTRGFQPTSACGKPNQSSLAHSMLVLPVMQSSSSYRQSGPQSRRSIAACHVKTDTKLSYHPRTDKTTRNHYPDCGTQRARKFAAEASKLTRK